MATQAPLEIISRLDPSQPEIIRDVYSYALNTSNQALEEALLNSFPGLMDYLLSDPEYIEDLWIYAQVFPRPDIEDLVKPYLENPPWHKLLAIAIYEDIDPLIQLSLLNGTFTTEDLLIALVAAHRAGNEEMINYIGAMVGPELEIKVKKGYVITNLRGGEIPYRR